MLTKASLLQVTAPKFPVVIKIGHAHSGVAKVKVDSLTDFQVKHWGDYTKSVSYQGLPHNRYLR